MMKNKCERPCVWNSDHMERLNKHILHFKKKKEKKRKRGIVSEVAIFMEKMFSVTVGGNRNMAAKEHETRKMKRICQSDL